MLRELFKYSIASFNLPNLPLFNRLILPIVAGVIVHSDCFVFQWIVTEQFCFLEEIKTDIVFLFLKEYHGYQIAEFTEFLTTLLILFWKFTKHLSFEIEDLFQDIQTLDVLACLLELESIVFHGLQLVFLVDIRLSVVFRHRRLVILYYYTYRCSRTNLLLLSLSNWTMNWSMGIRPSGTIEWVINWSNLQINSQLVGSQFIQPNYRKGILDPEHSLSIERGGPN